MAEMKVSIDQWTESFDHVAAEWQALRSQRAVERVNSWEQIFEEYFSAQQELRDIGQWVSGPADLLSIIGRSRRETCHNAILAWLLDPGAPHGLGTLFLEGFLESSFPGLKVDPSTLAGTVTECEVARHNSRADIVIWSADVTVVVEVKVDHVERERQCDDLHDDFFHETNAQFVFLTPTGRMPTTATGDAETAFQALSFRAVRNILHAICNFEGEEHLASPGRQTMLCYLQSLELEFP